MAIIANYGNIVVEVTGTLHTGDGRIRATVRALVGEPFTVCTHGGPMNTDSAVVSPDLLTDVHQELPRQNGKIVPNYSLEEIEQYKPLFPVCSRQAPWMGINSD